jgi:hypothetical protein
MASLLHYNIPFEFKVYDSKTESLEDLEKTLQKIEADQFREIIAPLTLNGANSIAQLHNSLEIYIPTVNQKDILHKNFFHFYGGIDYEKQIEALKPLIQKELYIFDQASTVSQAITNDSIKEVQDIPITQITINKRVVKYKKLFENISFENNSSVIINTQPIKTSLLLSQFIYQDVNLSAVLSTQLSYNPLILSLTQAKDLEHFYIANSLVNVDQDIEESNLLMGGDIKYDWINYATTRFVHHILSKRIDLMHPAESLFSLPIINHQIEYPIEVLIAKRRQFRKIPLPKMQKVEKAALDELY